MDLTPRKTTDQTFQGEKLWLGSKHGTDSPITGTLLISAFPAGHITANGCIPSGTPVTKSGTTYGPSRLGTAPGTQAATCDGHLFEDVFVDTRSPAATTVACAIQWHGVVIKSKIPAPTGHTLAWDVTKGSPNVKYV